MKIKISKNFVVGALLLLSTASLIGCGGSGASNVTNPLPQVFPTGLYVATYEGDAVKYFSDFIGGNEHSETASSHVLCQAFDSKGRLYMGTSNSQVIMVPKPGSPNRVVLGSIAGTGVNQFNMPTKIVIDANDRIYVADYGNTRVVRFDDMTGTNWTTLSVVPYRFSNTDSCSSIAIDASNKLYVAMKSSGQLLQFGSMADNSPVKYGSLGSGMGQFQLLNDIHICSDGKILLVDTLGSRIARVNDMTGTGWITFGTEGNGTNEFTEPSCVATDSTGHIYIGDSDNCRVCRVDDMTGKGWMTFGSSGNGHGKFVNVADVTIHE